jgi:hypothetical protein
MYFTVGDIFAPTCTSLHTTNYHTMGLGLGGGGGMGRGVRTELNDSPILPTMSRRMIHPFYTDIMEPATRQEERLGEKSG